MKDPDIEPWKPNSRYRHVFVVIRIDELGDAPTPYRQDVVATKAFWSQEEADAEAERLNLANAAKGSECVVRVARIEGA